MGARFSGAHSHHDARTCVFLYVQTLSTSFFFCVRMRVQWCRSVCHHGCLGGEEWVVSKRTQSAGTGRWKSEFLHCCGGFLGFATKGSSRKRSIFPKDFPLSKFSGSGKGFLTSRRQMCALGACVALVWVRLVFFSGDVKVPYLCCELQMWCVFVCVKCVFRLCCGCVLCRLWVFMWVCSECLVGVW